MRYFTIFTRLALAAGFLPAGYVKIIGERFTDLHNNQPMGPLSGSVTPYRLLLYLYWLCPNPCRTFAAYTTDGGFRYITLFTYHIKHLHLIACCKV